MLRKIHLEFRLTRSSDAEALLVVVGVGIGDKRVLLGCSDERVSRLWMVAAGWGLD
jgi:hypothetical protein